ncbi:MAG: S-layer homology domain-containing protein [Lawsonibacter sp.]|nr:S-layer homology domain-containing protein [Lawsonibacter sp.]
MKNIAKRLLSLAAALSLCVSGAALSARGAEAEAEAESAAEPVVLYSADRRFSLTACEAAPGGEVTVAAEDLGGWDCWCAAVHLSLDGADRYSLVGPDGQLPFLPLAQAAELFPDARMSAEELSRTFTLTVPEEYEGWTVSLRLAGPTGASEIPLDPEPEWEPAAFQAPAAFRDVADNDWFQPYVAGAVQAGMMEGVSENDFGPGRALTVAELLTIAARLNAGFYGREIPRARGEWYAPFYSYCTEWNIISTRSFAEEDMGRPATRFELAAVFDAAGCQARTSRPVNQIANGFIPGLNEHSAEGRLIYRWYRAGLVSGGDGGFRGDAGVTRAEAAVVVCRLLMLAEPARIE